MTMIFFSVCICLALVFEEIFNTTDKQRKTEFLYRHTGVSRYLPD